MAAWTAAAAGLRTLLLEEHPEPGAPPHCTGKLSTHAFGELGLPDALIRNTLRAARICAPDGTVAEIRRARADSFVVDRDVLDRWLVERAVAAGATFQGGTRARAASRDGAGMRLDVDRERSASVVRAAVVIDAEGPRAQLAETAGIAPRRRLIAGLQYEMEGLDLADDDGAEVYAGAAWAPGFFAWLMPLGGGAARIGLGVDPLEADRPPVHYLERLLAGHPVASLRARGGRIVRKLAGAIPLLDGDRPAYRPGFLLAGDAAGHVKATSGGGIYYAMLGGRFAAETAARAIGGDTNAWRDYERRWRGRFGREVRFTARVRRALAAAHDEDMNRFVAAVAGDVRLRHAIETHGDTQFQSRLFNPVLGASLRLAARNREFSRTAARLIGAMVRTYVSDA
jgi:geranylgeranyl reductase family protein